MWDQCLYSACNGKSINDQHWPEGEGVGDEGEGEEGDGLGLKGETDELPEVTTKGSCPGSNLSISGTWFGVSDKITVTSVRPSLLLHPPVL